MENPVIDKVRKLYALAERGGTPAEGALAAELMEALCAKHNIDPVKIFGPRWKRPRGLKVFDLRFETEKIFHPAKVYSTFTQHAHTEEIKHVFGPCLSCRAEIRYPHHRASSHDWIRKQFEEAQREKLLKSLRAGRTSGTPSLGALVDILCKDCEALFVEAEKKKRGDLDAKRKAREKQQHAEYEEKEKRRRWLVEWRTPRPGEIEVKRIKRFFALSTKQDGRPLGVLGFCGRVDPRAFCRGSSPAYRMGAYSNGRLVAHYYGWQLEDILQTSYEDGVTDLFGPGLAQWIQSKCQDALVCIPPDVIWHTRPPVCGRHRDSLSSGHAYLVDDSEDWHGKSPCLVHTISVDGKIFATLRNFFTYVDIAQFVEEKLDLKLMEIGDLL